jgi:hypothetical protein
MKSYMRTQGISGFVSGYWLAQAIEHPDFWANWANAALWGAIVLFGCFIDKPVTKEGQG